jgi:hypothetical protein
MEERKDGVRFQDVLDLNYKKINEQKLFSDERYEFCYKVFKKPVYETVSINPVSKNRYFCELSEYYSHYPSDIYELDHKDGNHFNNIITNIMCLCKLCHAIKTKLQRDNATSSQGTVLQRDIYKMLSDRQKFDEYIKGFLEARKAYLRDRVDCDAVEKKLFEENYDNLKPIIYDPAAILKKLPTDVALTNLLLKYFKYVIDKHGSVSLLWEII